MSQKISSYNEIVSTLMHFIAGITFFFTAQIMVLEGLFSFYVQVLFVVCYAAVIIIRHFINGNFIIYIFAHLTLFSAMLVIPLESAMFIMFGVYLIVMTVWSVSFWKNNGVKNTGGIPWFSVVALCLSYIYAFVTHHNILKNYIFVAGCIYLLLFVVKMYMKGLYDLSKNRMFHKQLPLKQIIVSNSFMIGFIISIMMISMIVFNIINIDDLIYVIGDFLLVVLRILIKAFFAILTWIADLFKNADFMDIGSIMDALGEEVMEEGLLSKILNFIFAVLKIGITLLFLFYVGKSMNAKISQLLKDNNLPTDKVEHIKVKDSGIKYVVEHIIKKNADEPKSPIRRKYKRAILKFGKKLVLNKSMTVGQIEAQMTEKEAFDMRNLKEAYERERYKDEL